MVRTQLPSRKAWIVYLVTVLPVVALIEYVGFVISEAVGVLRLEPIMFFWDSETGGGSEIEGWTLSLLGYPIPPVLGVLVSVLVAVVLGVMWLQVVRVSFTRGSQSVPRAGA